MSTLFSYRQLNAVGKARAEFIQKVFEESLSSLDLVLQRNTRERSLMITHLEIACMFAKKAMSLEDEVQVEKEPKT